jgi:hypothetical protein
MSLFLSGAMMMGFAVAGLFFLRYYRQTRDRLFLMFGCAFFVMSFNRWALVLAANADEPHTMFYVVRLVAFLLILGAILDKNRSGRGNRSGP